MKSPKGIFIKAIREGQAVEGVFLVKELNQGETRAGKPFLRLTLMDKSGEIGGPVWDDAEALAPHCAPGNFVRIVGQGDSYQGKPQLKINRVTPVAPTEVALEDFMPSGNFDREELEAELERMVAEVSNPHLASLLKAIFIDDHQLRAAFSQAPAAKSMHHAYLGGLLEHTLAVARLALAVGGLYPGIDRDLLLAGALLHDLGKTSELTFEGYPFGYSNQGRLVGHLVIGAEIIRARAAKLPDFPPELVERLQHLVLSHHGRHEFGAPTLPMIKEAFILNFLDDLDAKVNYFNKLEDQLTEPGYQWSDYQRNMERFLLLKGHCTEEPSPRPAKSNQPRHTPGSGNASRGSAPPPTDPDQGGLEESAPRQKPLWG